MSSRSAARNRVRAAAATGWWTPQIPGPSSRVDSYRHRRGWVLTVEFTEHGEISAASIGRWEPSGVPSAKLAAVLKVLETVK